MHNKEVTLRKSTQKPRPLYTLLSRESVRITCLLIFCLMIAFFDVVFQGRTFKVTTANSQALPTGVYGQEDNKPPFIPVNGTDSPVLEEPVYQFIKENLRQGILPLWNPHQACGFPLIGMIEIGLFFPLSFILYLLPSFYAWDVLILARLLLAGLFAFWFMRTLGFRKVPSFSTAVMFMLSGPLVLLQYWTANVDILTPLLFVALERLVRQAKATNLTFLAAVVALTILAGHPEHIFLVNALGAAFFLYRLFVLRKSARGQKSCLYYFAAYLLGTGLSAVVFFPFLQNFLFEFWHGHPEGVGLLMEEQRARALTLALPHFFQVAPITYQWVFAGWWGGYLGVLPLALAFLSLFHNHKRGLNYFFCITAFILICKEYGLPIVNWLGYFPIFDMVRYAIHTPPLAALCVSIAAGMGVRTILATKNNFIKSLIFSVLLLLVVAVHLIALRTSLDLDVALRASLIAGLILLVFLCVIWVRERGLLKNQWISTILVIMIFAELFSYIHRERPRRFDSFAKVPYIELLKSSPVPIRSYGIFWAFYPNTATGFGVDDLGVFFSLVPKRFVNFTNTLIIKDHFKNDLRPPALRAIPIKGNTAILDLLNVRYIIAPPQDHLAGLMSLTKFPKLDLKLKTVYSREVSVMDRPSAFPRAFIVHRALFRPEQEETLPLLAQIGGQLRDVVIINHLYVPSIFNVLQETPVKDRSTANIVKYTPNEVVVDADMENPGFLVLSDAYHPDWKVFVNGGEAKLFQADYLIRAVFLPQGNHQVRFVFKPLSFYLGALVSLLSLFVLCLPFIIARVKASKEQA